MEGLKEEQVKIDVSKLASLIDDPQSLKFPLNALTVEVKIPNTYPQIANALIRAAVMETPHYALDVIYESISKTDRDINTDLLTQNIALLPLRYGLTDKDIDGINMELNITNNGTDMMQVRAGDISFIGSYKPTSAIFMPTTQLIALGPGKRLVVKNIKIVRGMGIDHAKFATARDNYRCMRIDDSSKPIIPDLMNPNKRDYMIQFEVNCVLPNSTDIGRTILHNGCDTILHRLGIIRDIVESKEVIYLRQEKDRLELTVPGETHTIACLLERVIVTEYPNIRFISINVSDSGMKLVLSSDDQYSILIKSVDKCRAIYLALRESI